MKHPFILVAVVFLSLQLSGQNGHSPDTALLPAEVLELHLARTCYFPEEVVAYAVYCTNPLFPELELSRLAFVELISEQNTPLVRQKILLEQGCGAGSFQIPEDIPSGFYTLLVYTSWLKNFGETAFHSQGLVILSADQKILPDSASSKRPVESAASQTGRHTSRQGIELHLQKDHYAYREKVNLKIRLDQEEADSLREGHFSLSVRLSEPSLYHERTTVPSGIREGITRDKLNYLPDFKGLRLTGTLLNANGNTLPEAEVILSMPGPGTLLYHTRTDKGGKFDLLLPAQHGESDLVFTLPENQAVIKLDEPYWNGFRVTPSFPALHLDPSAATLLEKRFELFQLKQRLRQADFLPREQASREKTREAFYTHPGFTLHLDEYIQLDSLSEYFYELIPSVQFVQNRMKSEIRVMDPVSYEKIEESPGVFLDGVLYPDYHEISQIPVGKLDRITVLAEVYYYRELTFGGIVDIHTRASDFTEVRLLPNMARYILPLSSGNSFRYNSRDYSPGGVPDRIPDLRSLLYWDTELILDATMEKEIHFYTGDVPGEYTIELCGITSQGKLIRAETRMFVRDPGPESPLPD